MKAQQLEKQNDKLKYRFSQLFLLVCHEAKKNGLPTTKKASQNEQVSAKNRF